jgi:hypothetical protein
VTSGFVFWGRNSAEIDNDSKSDLLVSVTSGFVFWGRNSAEIDSFRFWCDLFGLTDFSAFARLLWLSLPLYLALSLSLSL